MKERIVVKIRKEEVKFPIPTCPAPKANGKGRKVVDARRLNAEQREVHFRID
jgi:hypothetical protein